LKKLKILSIFNIFEKSFMRKINILYFVKLFAVVLIVATFFSSCKMLNSSEMFKTGKSYKYADFSNEKKEYVIRPYDKLDLEIYTNNGFRLIDNNNKAVKQQIKTYYIVESDGKVKVPTLGRVNLQGLTIRQAEDTLEKLYKPFYNKPFVLLNVVNRRVLVFNDGANKATVLTFENENFSLIEAIAQAGGISDFSKSYKIKLLRGNLNKPQIFLFNIRNIKDMQNANFTLQANDIIYVESRPKYASRIFSEISPYLSLLSTGILIYGLLK